MRPSRSFGRGTFSEDKSDCPDIPDSRFRYWAVSASGVYLGVACVLFDEFAARRHVVAHQHREDAVCFGGVLDGYLTQDARFRDSWWSP